ncbi:MAG: DUF1559 domain-containing protein [Planctomycetes bacterium]|nr:DUF1559 domain-containing protein [Planctomycetota bacterium]
MRRGLNAMRLAVVLVVLSLLAAAVLPAIQKMRVTSALTRCRNNLQQHGLALHNYADTNNGYFPSGTMPNPDLPPEQRFSFHAVLLPFMECDRLYSQLAKSEAWDSDRNVDLLAPRTFELYQCPVWVRFHGYGTDLTASGHRAFTNYVGVAGVGADAATRSVKAPDIGIFGYERRVNMSDVSDGSSNTAMLIETTHDVGPWPRGGPSTVRAVEPGGSPFGGTHRRTSWMYQTPAAGFHIVLADASVRHTKPDIAPAVLAALATAAGGEVTGDW